MQKGPPISGRSQMWECKSASYETVIVPRMLACGAAIFEHAFAAECQGSGFALAQCASVERAV